MHRASNPMQQPAGIRATPRLAAVVAVVAALLGGCMDTLTRSAGDTQAQEQRAAAQMRAGNYLDAARTFERLAGEAQGQRRDAYLLDAMGAWYSGGDAGRAGSALRRMDNPPASESSPMVAVLAAMLSLQEGEPQATLDTLAVIAEPAPASVAPFARELEGRARFKLGDAAGATRALVEREVWLSDRAGVLANHRILWDGLTAATADGAIALPDDADNQVAGWLELANLHARARSTGEAFEPLAAGWRAANPLHPASTGLLDTVLGIPLATAQYPANIALLLPVSGRLQVPAEAVRDGFIAAYLADGDSLNPPTVRVYDTNALGADVAYQQALTEGAGLVVGPLSKRDVQAVSVVAVRQVTTLALNYLPDEYTAPPAFFQFGLAPEEEARRAAENALAYGYTRAVALVPADAWGGRMVSSFAASFEALGGTLLEQASYDPTAADHRGPIRSLLHLDLSEQRRRSLEARLGLELQFQPRRRQDAQFIFLASRPEPGRLLRPQLKFHYALDLPVFATAAIYEPDERANDDLNGVLFADMPWIINPDVDTLRLRNEFRSLWPRRFSRVQRLYALGYDAYRLIPHVYNRAPPMETPVPGLSGTLTVDITGRVRRELDWARIVDGQVVPEALPVADPTETLPGDEALDADIAAAGAR